MRIGHMTDIHWCVRPRLRDLTPKRVLGSANLYLRGRHRHFSPTVQDHLMNHVGALGLDLIVISGDLTAQALPSEFELAKQSLLPLLENTPCFMIPGNHDVYTRRAYRQRHFEKYFDPWMGIPVGAIRVMEVENTLIIGLHDSCPTWISAAGRVPSDQIDSLVSFLNKEDYLHKYIILCLHYPIVHRSGEIYQSRSRGLRNVDALVAALGSTRRKPDIILHGHEHHGYETVLNLSGNPIPIVDCGSSGYAFRPQQKRAAAMNVYEIQENSRQKTCRYVYTEAGFQLEGAHDTSGVTESENL